MSNFEKAARLALARLKTAQVDADAPGQCRDLTEIQIAGDLWPETVALHAALAQQAEPVVVQAEPVVWVGLTDADMDELAPYGQYAADVALLVEERLRERNAKQAEPVVESGDDDLPDRLLQIHRAAAAAAVAKWQREQAEPVAWRYKGEPWFDGDHWHDKYEVTTDERVARFKDKNAQPLYISPQQAEPVQAEPVVEPEHWVVTTKVGDIVGFRAPGLKKGDKVYPRPQQQAEPVVCVCGDPTSLGIVHRTDGPCFAPPQQAEPVAWVGLTDAEIYECWPGVESMFKIARAIEAALKEKNAQQAEPVVEPVRDLAHEKEMRELQQRQVASDCADDSGNPSF